MKTITNIADIIDKTENVSITIQSNLVKTFIRTPEDNGKITTYVSNNQYIYSSCCCCCYCCRCNNYCNNF